MDEGERVMEHDPTSPGGDVAAPAPAETTVTSIKFGARIPDQLSALLSPSPEPAGPGAAPETVLAADQAALAEEQPAVAKEEPVAAAPVAPTPPRITLGPSLRPAPTSDSPQLGKSETTQQEPCADVLEARTEPVPQQDPPQVAEAPAVEPRSSDQPLGEAETRVQSACPETNVQEENEGSPVATGPAEEQPAEDAQEGPRKAQEEEKEDKEEERSSAEAGSGTGGEEQADEAEGAARPFAALGKRVPSFNQSVTHILSSPKSPLVSLDLKLIFSSKALLGALGKEDWEQLADLLPECDRERIFPNGDEDEEVLF